MSLRFRFKVVKHWVFLRDSGSEFHTVGPKTEKDLFPKGLKREARNCQQRGVKRAQRSSHSSQKNMISVFAIICFSLDM